MEYNNRPYFIFLIILVIFGYKESNAQKCTKFALTNYSIFGRIDMNEATLATIDDLMITFFKNYPGNLEDEKKFSNEFYQKVFTQIPDSISKRLSFNSLLYYRNTLKDIYTIEKNGFSIAFNQIADDYTRRYYLEGISPKGMEIFVYQYVYHMPTLFQLENAGFDRVSPVKLKQMVLDEYKQYLSPADLMVVSSGWDRKINDFIRSQSQRDSAYAVSLQIMIPKIDSLKAIYLDSLRSMSRSLFEILNPEEQAYWKETTNKYLDKIDAIAIDELRRMKQYDDEYYPNVLRYHEYFYDLKKVFPSSNFWSWRKGPILNLSPALLESNSEFLILYTQFENALIEILDKYAANFAFPNYYFSGSQTYSSDKIKKIRVANAVMFSAIAHNY